jgi:hypothetical protein
MSPIVEILPLQINGTSLSLNFTVNQPVSEVVCGIDNQYNVTISGNTTLTGLPYGKHELVVYATNAAGNTGVSKMVIFTIPNPFPFTTVIAVSGTIAIVVVVGLLVYFKKHKQTNKSQT